MSALIKSTHICNDCGYQATYDAMALHVRTVHNREPKSGPTIGVGDDILHQGVRCRVLKLNADGSGLVQPLPPRFVFHAEYRVSGGWEVR